MEDVASAATSLHETTTSQRDDGVDDKTQNDVSMTRPSDDESGQIPEEVREHLSYAEVKDVPIEGLIGEQNGGSIFEVENYNSLRSGSKSSIGEKRVRFTEHIKALNTPTEDMGFDLHSANSRETTILWETITDEKGAVIKDHKISSESTDSVFDSRVYDGNPSFWEGKETTDLDEVLSGSGVKSRNVFRDLLEERRSEKVSDGVGDGGYVSLEAAGGSGGGGGGAVTPTQHTCGSLFAQCGAYRQPSLVTTFSHGRYGSHDSDDSYSGPVSLTEILSEREPVERMCRLDTPMGNGASTGAKGSQGQLPVESTQLQREIRHWEERVLELGEEVATLRKEVKSKDHEILRLQREIHKLKVRTNKKYSMYIICLF